MRVPSRRTATLMTTRPPILRRRAARQEPFRDGAIIVGSNDTIISGAHASIKLIGNNNVATDTDVASFDGEHAGVWGGSVGGESFSLIDEAVAIGIAGAVAFDLWLLIFVAVVHRYAAGLAIPGVQDGVFFLPEEAGDSPTRVVRLCALVVAPGLMVAILPVMLIYALFSDTLVRGMTAGAVR